MEGVDGATLRNVEAAKGLAGIVCTSLGPNGMNKLVINHLEKIIVTSDCATIVKELEIQHPAAKMLELAAEMQEQEVSYKLTHGQICFHFNQTSNTARPPPLQLSLRPSLTVRRRHQPDRLIRGRTAENVRGTPAHGPPHL